MPGFLGGSTRPAGRSALCVYKYLTDPEPCASLAQLPGSRTEANPEQRGVKPMKSLSRNLLMGAILAALPMSGALACTVSQWNGSKTALDADAVNPVGASKAARYSGICSLKS